jgi:hypothetical protein
VGEKVSHPRIVGGITPAKPENNMTTQNNPSAAAKAAHTPGPSFRAMEAAHQMD